MMNPLQLPDAQYRAMVYLVKNYTPKDDVSSADIITVDGVTGMTMRSLEKKGMLRKMKCARVGKKKKYFPAVYRIESAAYDRVIRLCDVK